MADRGVGAAIVVDPESPGLAIITEWQEFRSPDFDQLKALLTAGFVLFVITLIINTLAAMIVSRSRSGALTD